MTTVLAVETNDECISFAGKSRVNGCGGKKKQALVTDEDAGGDQEGSPDTSEATDDLSAPFA